MARKRRTSTVLETARERLAGLKSNPNSRFRWATLASLASRR